MPQLDKPDSLGRRLRSIRYQKGMESPATLSRAMRGRYSVSGILKRERGEIKIDLDYIDLFSKALALSSNEHVRLRELGKVFLIQFDPWRSSSKNAEDLHVEYWARLKQASTYREVGTLALVGLCQTERYAYEMMMLHSVDQKDAREASKLRSRIGAEMLKRAASKSNSRKDILCIIDEEALYRVVGSRTVMGEQLAHLAAILKSNPEAFRLLPRGTNLPVPLMYSFCVFDSMSATLETAVGAVHCTDQEAIAWLNRAFDLMYDASVGGHEANALLRRAANNYR
ncbi:MAG: Scr1 family TA system antitoxin-like transcriptional regulator [Bdellovibrionota bacterium]|nr:MAG: Scr1 family TA system antitoxin-like transcriptional regulator [Bdellovibrionota bacterium]